ncbi:MAG: hypothetical protein IPK98_15130 [Chloracidobacterium sp.]|nr:hypothetical protein [Chloracidobacterium sp.]
MKKIISGIVLGFVFVGAASAQVLPVKIKKFLDDYYTSSEMGKWQQAPGACSGRKWLLTGDFNDDGRTDYLVRILAGRGIDRSLHLIGFINEKGDYTPDPFLEEEYTGDTRRTATTIIKKGSSISSTLLGEGEGSTRMLTTDLVNQYICETDAAIVYSYKDGQFKKYGDGGGNEVLPGPLPQVFPTPKPTPKPTATPIIKTTPRPTDNPPVQTPSSTTLPNIVGSYRIYKADGKVDASGGTVVYENGVLTFKISDGRAFSTATAFVKDGVISTGWGRTAIVSPDGQTIFWSDKTRWVRR